MGGGGGAAPDEAITRTIGILERRLQFLERSQQWHIDAWQRAGTTVRDWEWRRREARSAEIAALRAQIMDVKDHQQAVKDHQQAVNELLSVGYRARQ